MSLTTSGMSASVARERVNGAGAAMIVAQGGDLEAGGEIWGVGESRCCLPAWDVFWGDVFDFCRRGQFSCIWVNIQTWGFRLSTKWDFLGVGVI